MKYWHIGLLSAVVCILFMYLDNKLFDSDTSKVAMFKNTLLSGLIGIGAFFLSRYLLIREQMPKDTIYMPPTESNKYTISNHIPEYERRSILTGGGFE
jgi:hypothetical protein